MASVKPSASKDPRRSRGARVLLGVLAVAVVFGIVIASIGYGLFPLYGTYATSSTPPSAANSTGGLDVQPALCTDLTPAQELSDAKAMNAASAAVPAYDEQLWMEFQQNFTSSLGYNVTLRAQNDSLGFGPVFLLNGLTDAGYWYQVGVGWNLAYGSGSQYYPGFTFLYEVWNASASLPVFPGASGAFPASFSAYDGDTVLLSLGMTAAGQVSLTAFDWNTSARADASYGGFGASHFLGLTDRTPNFPTSLLTEWFHTLPYSCFEEPVVYSNTSVTLGSSWLRIDEWNLTGISGSQGFNSTVSGECCVFSTAIHEVAFQDAATFQRLTTNGTTIYANAHEFVTP
jgi:hypothetical protein